MTTGPDFPQPSSYPPPLEDTGASRAALKAPAIVMLVVNALSVTTAPVVLLFLGPIRSQLARDAETHPELRDVLEVYQSHAVEAVLAAGFVMGAIAIFGAIRMLQARSYGLALASAVLTMVNLASCCCLVNLAIGIWALVVLMRDDVQRAFVGR